MSQLTTHHETEIVADEKVPLIRISREFEATAAKVFRAHADPDIYAKWSGPRNMTTTVRGWDFRSGGSWRYDTSDSEGNKFGFSGSFHEVRPNELIVQTFSFDGYPDSVSLERLTLEDLGNGRSRLVATSLVDSFEARDAMIESGMEHGICEGYEKLDDILATTEAS